MTDFTLDWRTIRPLNGARSAGFEELCAQLARIERPEGSRFDRKGTPDAGVECYATLADGSEWGWQAKYFDELGDSQFSQLDSSVKTAIEKHPRLAKYHICIPLDRPDARLEGRMSALERWNGYVTRWQAFASARGMNVEFVYWGSSELLELLSRTEHVGRVRFWFNVRGFDKAWFMARVDESISTAGPRYTHELHVDLPIAGRLEAFGRTPRFFDEIKSYARGIRKALRTFELSVRSSSGVLDSSASELVAAVQAILPKFSRIEFQPDGTLSLTSIGQEIAEARTKAEGVWERWLDQEANESDRSLYEASKSQRHALHRLSQQLRQAQDGLEEADKSASNNLLIVTGNAGTGKTHLLCDIARRRLESGMPTVLLMGQRFLEGSAPWPQALQQLDLADVSAEQFVGALEAAAQAANARALLLIDALNEGNGRIIWPSHLASFLSHLERSQWIGTVLSVRSSYEAIVIPETIRTRADTVVHSGFDDREYDATKEFFSYYGLELPSSPLLTPEFRNPLFLKAVCKGLHARGETRLPRGFHGITSVFDLYLSSVNETLSSGLGFDRTKSLVSKALSALADEMVRTGERWLTRTRAGEIVDELFPNREFERSLFRGLIVEGMLVEEARPLGDLGSADFVFIAYERLADHLVARRLLQGISSEQELVNALETDGSLNFLKDTSKFVSPGLLEALCTQVPEITRRELMAVEPAIQTRWAARDCFRQSLVWRARRAFSDETLDLLNALIETYSDEYETLNVLMTLTMIPQHPLNAEFLDRNLRNKSMPDRDAWWSIYLHRNCERGSPIDRLVDWALSIKPDTNLEGSSVDLCATSLAWLLTTSNRFLRDRATQALVVLLTGRLAAAETLVKKFADVNDLYVRERIYAVAYGVCMRSHDASAVGSLGATVYELIFSQGTPVPHILLRDYARGVIERALYLNASITVDTSLVRPPYRSEWPEIPSEEEIKALVPESSPRRDDNDWARRRIGTSVLSDDFARYVIGTNSWMTNWLSVRREEPRWKSANDIVNEFAAGLSKTDEDRWTEFETAEKEYAHIAFLLRLKDDDDDSGTEPQDKREPEPKTEPDSATDVPSAQDALASYKQQVDEKLAALKTGLDQEKSARLDTAVAAIRSKYTQRDQTPKFDLRIIQRYVLARVFELGWTTELFGDFDTHDIGYRGREPDKPERIGKKYQWIAYHEIMALISDHFQYRREFYDEGDTDYEGPWQEHLRDIDPSCPLKSTVGGTTWDGHVPAWWASREYRKWDESASPSTWAGRYEDLPEIPELLTSTDPSDGSRWINGQSFFIWRQAAPPDVDPHDVESREIWYICNGYLIKSEHAEAFIRWAEDVDFWGRWMPDPPEVYKVFLGEHGWAPASLYFQKNQLSDNWLDIPHGCPGQLQLLAFEYLREAKTFDCSVVDTYTLKLPSSPLVNALPLKWTARGADFEDSSADIAAQDPTYAADGPDALLLRADMLRDFLTTHQLALCWVVTGEKRTLSSGLGTGPHHQALRLSGAYLLKDSGVEGFLKCMVDDPAVSGPPAAPIAVLRSPH